jgi:hypothetical protein
MTEAEQSGTTLFRAPPPKLRGVRGRLALDPYNNYKSLDDGRSRIRVIRKFQLVLIGSPDATDQIGFCDLLLEKVILTTRIIVFHI